MHIISLEVGDGSGDGHSMTQVVVIESNLSHKNLQEAYEKGSKIIGFDLKKKVACEYEDRVISEEYLEILASHNIQVKWQDEYDEKERELWSNTWVYLWLDIAKLGNPSLEYKEMTDTLTVGGYGLFFP